MIVNNTFVHTDGVELLVQFDTRNNVIANNVIEAGPAHRFVENPYRENFGNIVDHNLYYSHDGSPVGRGNGRAPTTRTSMHGRRDRGTTTGRSSPTRSSPTQGAADYSLSRARRLSTPVRSSPSPARPI